MRCAAGWDGRAGLGFLTPAQVYLMKYGYLDTSTASQKSAPLLSEEGLRNYIEEFQAFANLTVTGELDAETVEMMGRPRCGVKDVVGHGSKREKRYALQGKSVLSVDQISKIFFQGRGGR